MDNTPAWHERFTTPRIIATSVAPADRTAGLVTIAGEDHFRFHAWDVPTGTLTPADLPPSDPHYFAAWLSHDGRHAYGLSDDRGNEIGHLSALELRGGAEIDLTPTLEPYALRGVGVSATGAGLALVAVDRDGHHLYRLAHPSAPDPEPRLLASYPAEARNCLLSADGTVATIDTTDRNPGVRQFVVEAWPAGGGPPLGRYDDGPGSSVEAHLLSPRPGDPTVVVLTDRSGTRRPVLWHITDDTRRPLSLPDLPGDVLPVDWSDDGRYLLLVGFWRAAQRLLRYDLHTDRVEALDVPAGSYHGEMLRGAHFAQGSHFGPNRAVLASVESAASPLAVHRHQPGAGTELVLAGPPVRPGQPARSVDFPSSDGTLVQGWLVTPDTPGPHPTVVLVHGGPHMPWWDLYIPALQVWVDNGYAVMAPNYRGSTTFGREYSQAIWGRVGHWELADLVAAHQWLTRNRVADPERILVAGGSYGGYLVLWALTRRPNLWAGGVAEVGIADWSLMYEDANPALRRAIALWHQGTPEEVPQRYRDSSPLTYVADLAAPLLIRQGRYDSRAPARQMEAFEEEARRLGKPVTVRWDERGHAPLAGDLAFRQQLLDFAAGCHRPRPVPGDLDDLPSSE